MRDCIHGRTTFMASFVQDIVCALEKQDSDNTGSKLYVIPTAHCRKTRGCSRGMVDILGKLAKSAVYAGRVQVFDSVEEICFAMPPADENEFGVFCDNCFEKLSDVFEICRIKFWEDLPTFFNLSPWEMLIPDEFEM